jgi:RNA polymerase sigma-70 factor, ECF subfamily
MHNSTVDDSTLISALRKDNLKAFETLYNRYSKSVYRFALKYLLDPEESKELVQTVFISLWEHRKSLDELKPVKSYIFKSAVNTIFNMLKKKAIRRKFILAQLQKPEDFSNPYEQIFFNDLDERISEVINSLAPQQREIYNLKSTVGLTCEEIAQKMQLSVRTIENQLYRVNKILKQKFKPELFSDKYSSFRSI